MSLRTAPAFLTRLPVGTPPANAGFHGLVGRLPVVGILVGAAGQQGRRFRRGTSAAARIAWRAGAQPSERSASA